MASNDVTYLFFQRDSAAEDDIEAGLSPSIQSARVIRHGGLAPPTASTGSRLRSGSMPAVSLRSGSVPPIRAGSVMRGGSVAPQRPIATVMGGGSTSTSSVSYYRPSAVGGGGGSSGVILGVRHDGTTGPLPSFTARRRASISVLPSAAAAYRPQTASYMTSRGVTPSRQTNHTKIFRADDFMSSLPAKIQQTVDNGPRFTSSSSRRSTTLPPAAATSYRRTSVSGPSRSRITTTTTSSALEGDGLSAAPRRSTQPVDNDSTYRRTSSATLVGRRPDFERERESLASLRQRTNKARDQLSRHRVLLDRYMPFNMGPNSDVNYEVEYKVNELYPRMPELDPNRAYTRRFDVDNEPPTVRHTAPVTPYKPLPRLTKVELPPPYPFNPIFTPKISDVRKRARSVLCKVKGDPHYFDF